MSSTSSTYGPSTAPVSRFRVAWMPIPESAYEANTLGMIRNARTKRPLTPFSDRDGYLLVQILQAGRQGLHYVHRLVLLAFAGGPPTPRHQAAHADGCRQHNAVWNLRWATPRENAADRRRHRAIRKATVSARRRPSHRHQRRHLRTAGRTWRVAR